MICIFYSNRFSCALFFNLNVNHDLHFFILIVSAVRYTWADAGTDVPSQSLRVKPEGLPQDNPLSKMAKNGGTTW